MANIAVDAVPVAADAFAKEQTFREFCLKLFCKFLLFAFSFLISDLLFCLFPVSIIPERNVFPLMESKPVIMAKNETVPFEVVLLKQCLFKYSLW